MPEKNIKPQSDHTRCPVDTIHPQHAPVWMRVPAWRQLLRPVTVNRSSLWPRPHRYLLLPRLERGSRLFFRVHPSYRYWYFHSCRGSSPDDTRSSLRIASHYVNKPPCWRIPCNTPPLVVTPPAIWSGYVHTRLAIQDNAYTCLLYTSPSPRD